MKVLLIKPSTGEIYKELKEVTPEYPPLGLAYIAAVLEQNGHEVKILDNAIAKLDKQSLIRYVGNFSPSVVGFTATTPTIEIVYKMIDDLRFTFDDISYVIGGPHATALANEALDYADVVIRGEGEYTFLEFTELKEKSNISKLKKIDGLSFKYKNKKIHNKNRAPLMELNKLPLPARHLLSMNKYHYFGARKHPLTNMFTSRGCPFNCNYCNKNIFGHTFRAASVKRVMEEIDLLVNELGIKEIHISDDTFNLDKRRVIGICKEIKKRNYDLVFYPHNGVRVNSINKELLNAFYDAGFYAIVYGIESGSQRILNNIKKGITIEQVEKAFKLTRQFDFEIWGFFILGLLGETKESAKKTIDFAIKLNPDIAKFSILVPFPGTEIYNIYKDRINIKNWSDFGLWSGPTFEPENMTKEELMDLYKLAYRRFYLRPSPIWKLIKRNINSPSRMIESIKAGMAVLKLGK